MEKSKLILLICFMSFLSCSTAGDLQPSKDKDDPTEQIIDDDIDEEISVDEEEIVDEYLTSGIIGKWKLMKVVMPTEFELAVYDYSKDNIIYEFKSNGILTISGVPKDNRGYRAGDYTYSIVQYYNDFYELKIGDYQKDPCQISNNKMQFGSHYVDGPVFYLDQIE